MSTPPPTRQPLAPLGSANVNKRALSPAPEPPPRRPTKITNFFTSSRSAPQLSTPPTPSLPSASTPPAPANANANANVLPPTPTKNPPPPPLSKSAQQLAAVSPKAARNTLERLKVGYTQKSGQGYPAMQTNMAGCWLAQKSTNRADNGYVQISPMVESTGRSANGVHKEAVLPQGAHRLAVRAWKSEEDSRNITDKGWDASHLCHQPTCFNPDHIVVEPKWLNELRKKCAGYGGVITLVNILGQAYKILPAKKCSCADGKCIQMVQNGIAERA